MPPEHAAAFAPGRVNLIGEHTDYNGGLALPFAIREGITAEAEALDGPTGTIRVQALDLGEQDEFPLARPPAASGWRAYVRGIAAELCAAGCPLRPALLRISGDLPRGAGLSSSAALEVAVALALLELCGGRPWSARPPLETIEIARLCSRVENEWAGAQTGLLDQLASLAGSSDHAVRIDFESLELEPVPLRLQGWQLVVLDSGERHANVSSGYNERRRECTRAAELLGVSSLRRADPDSLEALPEPLRRRTLHVLGECERVEDTVRALQRGELGALGPLLDASHASLRDLYEVSTPAVETAVTRLRDAGAAGARLVGGGFGGSVLGLFAPGTHPPPGARPVQPGPGARALL